MKLKLTKTRKSVGKVILYSFILPIAVILYGIYLTEFHNLSPIQGKIDLKKTEYQKFNFSIDYPGKYFLKIDFDTSIDTDSLLGLGNMNVFADSTNDTSFYYNWLISSVSGEIVTSDSDTTVYYTKSTSFSKDRISRTIGYFLIEEGNYIFEIRPSKPRPELSFTNPRLNSYIVDETIRDYGYIIAFALIPSIIITLVLVISLVVTETIFDKNK